MYKGKGRVGDILNAVIICHEMKWDYYTYFNQPEWFLTALRTKLNMDIEYRNKSMKIKKHGRKG